MDVRGYLNWLWLVANNGSDKLSWMATAKLALKQRLSFFLFKKTKVKFAMT